MSVPALLSSITLTQCSETDEAYVYFLQLAHEGAFKGPGNYWVVLETYSCFHSLYSVACLASRPQ